MGPTGYGMLTSALALGSLGGALLIARRPATRLRNLIELAGALAFAHFAASIAPGPVTLAIALLSCARVRHPSASAPTPPCNWPQQMACAAGSWAYTCSSSWAAAIGGPIIGTLDELFGRRHRPAGRRHGHRRGGGRDRPPAGQPDEHTRPTDLALTCAPSARLAARRQSLTARQTLAQQSLGQRPAQSGLPDKTVLRSTAPEGKRTTVRVVSDRQECGSITAQHEYAGRRQARQTVLLKQHVGRK